MVMLDLLLFPNFLFFFRSRYLLTKLYSKPSYNGIIETRVHRKKTKLPKPWTSNIPKRYKRNTIKTELYRAKRISSNFTNEVILIRNKFKSPG